MALSDLKAKRKGLRQAFTLNLQKIESELNYEIADRKELSVLRTLIDDSSTAEEDKMQYLLQSVEPHSKAERLVLSFPATAVNYSKAIEQLKERIGRDNLLVQIYVRDLLGLVMKNAVKEWSKTDLTYLYDESEGKLRALESLGRTQEKYGDFLIPLVESCIPEETLLAGERSQNHESTQNTRSLEHLMNFLRKEVQGEEMVQLARTGFGDLHIISERTMLPLNV
ncbi:DUF1758 domain-containing protein [Trichonephila clavipes]|nr:DUF1758 domain-containing protein [Trichonephila clavipes]